MTLSFPFFFSQIGDSPLSTATAELFGCPDRAEASYLVEDYPFRNYYTGSRFIEDGTDDRVIVCGGNACDGPACQVFVVTLLFLI